VPPTTTSVVRLQGGDLPTAAPARKPPVVPPRHHISTSSFTYLHIFTPICAHTYTYLRPLYRSAAPRTILEDSHPVRLCLLLGRVNKHFWSSVCAEPLQATKCETIYLETITRSTTAQQLHFNTLPLKYQIDGFNEAMLAEKFKGKVPITLPQQRTRTAAASWLSSSERTSA
jgi:hypothetical protein